MERFDRTETICNRIEDLFGDSYKETHQEDLFNDFDNYEVELYLEARLGCKFQEVSYTVLVSGPTKITKPVL